MSKRPTMQDVADASGVSLSTVDRILNRRSTVKPSTLKQVLEAAERVGFYGAPVIRDRLSEQAPACSFGFLLNPVQRSLYRAFAQALAERSRSASRVRARATIRHLARLDEALMVEELHRLADECDVIAAVLFDTPAIHQALRALAARGCAVVAMLTDIRTPDCLSFVGADPIKMGRGAAWIMRALNPQAGRILFVSGAAAYSAHQAYISGFRAFLQDRSCPFDIGHVLYSDEDDARAEALVRAILARERIDGIVVAGGGIDGVLRATAPQDGTKIIGTELSPHIDAALSDGRVEAVISHPFAAVVEQTVEVMEDYILSGRRIARRDRRVPVEIRISETV